MFAPWHNVTHQQDYSSKTACAICGKDSNLPPSVIISSSGWHHQLRDAISRHHQLPKVRCTLSILDNLGSEP